MNQAPFKKLLKDFAKIPVTRIAEKVSNKRRGFSHFKIVKKPAFHSGYVNFL
jgi:hypothetical protein